jgi:beta-aspartyl-peptidase (threonine type)
MKKNIFHSIIILIILIFTIQLDAQTNTNKYTLVLHGGAGGFASNTPDSIKNLYISSLKEALKIGQEILKNGGTSLDAVEKVINYLEDNHLFNAGRGAVFTTEGRHELDASIMNGKDLSSGAVAGVTIIKNPISLARLVMEKTDNVLFAGKGADELGIKLGLPVVHNSYFHTEEQYKEFLMGSVKKYGGETVGCVAIDNYGNIVAGTSTGGRNYKLPGRVGDSPIIAAGNYADNNTCGISATGIGELFIKNSVAFNISALMKYKGYTLKQACEEMMYKVLPTGAGGIIAVDKDGNYEMIFTTNAMFRGVVNSSGVFEVGILK